VFQSRRRQPRTHHGPCLQARPQFILDQFKGATASGSATSTGFEPLRLHNRGWNSSLQRLGSYEWSNERAKLPSFRSHIRICCDIPTGYKLANQGEDTRSLAHYLGIEIYIDGSTSFEVWSPRSAPSDDARARSSARAHRPARIAVYIPASFQCGPSLDPTVSEQVCALCREAFQSQTV